MKEDIILRDKCPICNSTSSKSIFNRSFNEKFIKDYMNVAYQGNADIEFLEDVNFEIVKCNGCNFSYQKYVLNEKRLNDLYNKWIDPKLAQEWNEDGDKISAKNSYIFILNFAKNYLKKEPAKIKVLDFGAGFGNALILAKEMGFDSYAYEYSVERIKFLEGKGIKTIDDKNEMLFDFVIVNQVLEHITYPDEILKIIISKLDKNGLAYLDVPNCPQLEKKLLDVNNIKEPNDFQQALEKASVSAFQHLNFFTNHSLKLLFRKCGAKPISPFIQSIKNPLTVKSVLRPIYRHYFSTGFFLRKL
jgi:2-polyprenyl-3-methyl-5-hydroxy-6-metoxy-1,4-benzoquinol methylase